MLIGIAHTNPLHGLAVDYQCQLVLIDIDCYRLLISLIAHPGMQAIIKCSVMVKMQHM